MSDTTCVVYCGRHRVEAVDGAVVDEVLDDWQVLPLALYPELDSCRDLIVLDAHSFPFDSLRYTDRSIRLLLHVPGGVSAEELVLLLDDVVLSHLGFDDRLIVREDAVWQELHERYLFASSQRIVPEGAGASAALAAACAHLRSTRTERVASPLGNFYAPENDLITRQLVEYGGHQRGDLSMLLSVVRPGQVIVDVGAHIGTFSIPLARSSGPTGHLFAFEPAELPFRLLERNVAANGLSERVTTSRAIVSDGLSQFRAVLDPGNTGATAFEMVDDGTGTDVDVTTLDAWWAANGRPRVDILKIDVEGMEMSVLAGARDLVRVHHPVIFVELSETQLASRGVSMVDVERSLAEHAYDLFVNVGPRNVPDDGYELRQVSSLSAYRDRLFDVLAVHPHDPVRKEMLVPHPTDVGRVQ